MTTLVLNSQIDLEHVIDGIGKLKNTEVENILNRLSILLAQRKAPSFSKIETALLDKINHALSSSIQQRYSQLTDKLRNNTLDKKEHKILIKFIDQVELADAKRLEAIIKLAGLRTISVDTLMQQLGIQAPQPKLSYV